MLKVRLANKGDSLEICSWRNDVHTQKMSLQKNSVDITNHTSWYLSQINDKNNLLLILETKQDVKVGIVRFNIINNTALISINIAPKMRGKRLAKQCLKLSMESFEKYFPNIDIIQAQILPINIPSIKSFENAGFFYDKTCNGVYYYNYSIR